MKLALLSDIHDQVWHLGTVLDWLQENPVDAMIVSGDLCSPFVLASIQEGFSRPVHIVFGNNDGDTFRMTRIGADHVRLHGEIARLVEVDGELISLQQFAERFPQRDFFDTDIGGKRIAVNHFPEIAGEITAAGRYDLVIYGHNHHYHTGYNGNTMEINPGTLMGYLPGSRKSVAPSFVVYDTETNQAQKHIIRFSCSDNTYLGEVLIEESERVPA